jgi:hypothetical protein
MTGYLIRYHSAGADSHPLTRILKQMDEYTMIGST